MAGFSDDELLSFDAGRLASYEERDARAALAEHGDVFRAQLVAAIFIDGWRERMRDRDSVVMPHSEDWHEGFDHALREVVAHLRQGDLIPGGVLYEDEVTGRRRR